MPLSRVHLHPYGSFLMCYDKNIWADAHDAIIKSSIALPKYCVRQEDGSPPKDWTNLANNFQVPELPTHIKVGQKKIPVTKDSLTYDFELSSDIDGPDDIKCYLQFFLKCKQMVKTAGMGDTISGTGFVYHETLPQ